MLIRLDEPARTNTYAYFFHSANCTDTDLASIEGLFPLNEFIQELNTGKPLQQVPDRYAAIVFDYNDRDGIKPSWVGEYAGIYAITALDAACYDQGISLMRHMIADEVSGFDYVYYLEDYREQLSGDSMTMFGAFKPIIDSYFAMTTPLDIAIVEMTKEQDWQASASIRQKVDAAAKEAATLIHVTAMSFAARTVPADTLNVPRETSSFDKFLERLNPLSAV